MIEIPFPTIVLAASVGAAAGYIGALMILRRMALVGDALTHVALPGMGAAFLLSVNPFFGAFTVLALSVIGVWALERSTRLYTEALIGLFFTAALALGILIIPDHELFEALFGSITDASVGTVAFTAIAAIVALAFARRLTPRLLLLTLSADLAQTHGMRPSQTNLIFLLVIAMVVALGISVIGTLLMGALVIIPALTAKRISAGFSPYAMWSMVLGAVTATGGVLVSALTTLPPGAAVVLVALVFLGISFLFRQSPA